MFLVATVSNKLTGNMSPVEKNSATSRVKKREQRHFSSICSVHSISTQYGIHRICSPNMVKLELKYLKKIILWNNFPSHIAASLIRRFWSNALNKNHTPTKSKTRMSPSPFGVLFLSLARKYNNFYIPLNVSREMLKKNQAPRSEYARKPQNCVSVPKQRATLKQIARRVQI